MVGNQCNNVRLVIHYEYALSDGGRFSHVLKLSGYSGSRQPTKCHDHLTEAVNPLLATIARG